MAKRIVIIGAGPIGCYTAQLLKTYGFDPLVVEEHGEVGKPVHCTGLVGSRVFEEKRRFDIPRSSVTNTINGARICYDGHDFVLERRGVAYVIARDRFDKELSAGLSILLNNRFLGLEKSPPGGYIVETDKEALRADIVIGADGANSAVRKILNQDANIRYYKGLQLRMKTKPGRSDTVTVHLKRPSFFWIVPESADTVRVGTISENPFSDLQVFLKEAGIEGSPLERFGGVVAIGICPTTAKDGIALVGDAACQMKPLTYGGVYFGLKAATILAECIKDDVLQEYDTRWKKELLSEIRIGLKAKDIYATLDEGELKKIFNVAKEQKTLIEKLGDFEHHSNLIVEVMKNPMLYPQIGDLMRILFKRILF